MTGYTRSDYDGWAASRGTDPYYYMQRGQPAMPKRKMTYYMWCKKWAEDQPETEGEWGHTRERDFLDTIGCPGRWTAEVDAERAVGRTREKACKRLWETLVELGLAEEEVTP